MASTPQNAGGNLRHVWVEKTIVNSRVSGEYKYTYNGLIDFMKPHTCCDRYCFFEDFEVGFFEDFEFRLFWWGKGGSSVPKLEHDVQQSNFLMIKTQSQISKKQKQKTDSEK